MNGLRVTSKLLEMMSGGGIRTVTFLLTGKLRMSFHLETSGNWFCNTLMVFFVAVAVIKSSFPERPVSSPVISAISGLKAFLEPFFNPQSATAKGE